MYFFHGHLRWNFIVQTPLGLFISQVSTVSPLPPHQNLRIWRLRSRSLVEVTNRVANQGHGERHIADNLNRKLLLERAVAFHTEHAWVSCQTIPFPWPVATYSLTKCWMHSLWYRSVSWNVSAGRRMPLLLFDLTPNLWWASWELCCTVK